MLYKKHLSEPWFTLVKQKKKTSEGRLNKGDFKEMNVGDIIEFFNETRKFKVKVKSKHRYKTFENMIRGERLSKVLPTPEIKTIKQGVNNVYYGFFSKADEKKYGIIAIRMTKV